ncbi:MAG: hypothetical protein DMG01_12580 [Acidobacteria bacterium]|nr:MAG: hypothetical protein DMG01_12580 [Acidobacteriota bacterium]
MSAIICLAAAFALTAEAAPLRLSVDEAVQRALEASHRLREAAARADAAEAVVEQRRASSARRPARPSRQLRSSTCRRGYPHRWTN